MPKRRFDGRRVLAELYRRRNGLITLTRAKTSFAQTPRGLSRSELQRASTRPKVPKASELSRCRRERTKLAAKQRNERTRKTPQSHRGRRIVDVPLTAPSP